MWGVCWWVGGRVLRALWGKTKGLKGCEGDDKEEEVRACVRGIALGVWAVPRALHVLPKPKAFDDNDEEEEVRRCVEKVAVYEESEGCRG